MIMSLEDYKQQRIDAQFEAEARALGFASFAELEKVADEAEEAEFLAEARRHGFSNVDDYLIFLGAP